MKLWMRAVTAVMINASTGTAFLVGVMVGWGPLSNPALALAFAFGVLGWSLLLAAAVEWALLTYYRACALGVHSYIVEGRAREAQRALESGRLDDVKLILAEFRLDGNGVQWGKENA